MQSPAPVDLTRLLGALAAVALPLLLSFAAVPDTVFYNQLAAFAGWGVWLLWRGGGSSSSELAAHRPAMLAASLALALCAFFAVLRAGIGQGAAALALLSAIAVLGSGARGGSSDTLAIARAWWLAGVLCTAVALLQYFAPSLADGGLIARNSTPGRAVGNLRQPNHLATALLCAMVMTAWLWQIGRLRAPWAAASIAAMVLA
ncbi:MAG: pilin glycosylation ligase domain-containing protein, partial [Methylibium sp.]|nr:pilin glycosylation ligase domain-containing protein [Methylibium sp.]